MSFIWNDYLTLAKTLSQSTDDASLRTAISRAYYCVFNLSLSKAKRNEFRPKDDASSHEQLWSLYGRNTEIDRVCGRISAIGGRMKRRRVNADYRLFYNHLADEAKDVLADAEEFISLLGQLPPDLPKDLPRVYRR
jgi:uncharacterized protein (UPF0332 family)